EKFEALFRDWVRGVIPHCHGVIAFDGKTIRGAYESEDDKVNRKAGRKECISNSKLQILSVYATAYGVFLSQIKVDEKSNEISAAPLLIDAIFMPGCIFTT
ncbi:MAG: ISAs1 family transposase, partial [Phocaeicola sp.]